ncbi:putative cytosolic cu zn superoxide dismutase protein [Erysiphe necator]|uniref:superoxide dismutase n=1 Tax=Uncinula necator TaxID=52586 RepID=A0A0B1P2D5_UNCNE|nr:putative cytosolic cu zn superoxide dismutase protein [Erysiphe necator]
MLAAPVIAQNPKGKGPLTGSLGNATVVEDNPPDVTYVAILPTQFSSKIRGAVSATGNSNGIGVNFLVNFTNFPPELGPFAYHVHVNPVPSDGNCSGALGHLDPFIRGEDIACEKALPQTCQVGDLSGKHGKITEDPFSASYLDEFVSTTMGIGAFLGNRSIVIHSMNKTRLTCANFTMLKTTTNTTNASSPYLFEGKANHIQATSFFTLALLSAFALLL